jgi:hypothetical protein
VLSGMSQQNLDKDVLSKAESNFELGQATRPNKDFFNQLPIDFLD